MESKNQNDLELYEALSALHAFYKQLYRDLEGQYSKCMCFTCKMRLVTFGMELVSINTLIEHLESELMPPVDRILAAMSISYCVSGDGKIALTF